MADKALEIIDLLDELRNNNLYVHNSVNVDRSEFYGESNN